MPVLSGPPALTGERLARAQKFGRALNDWRFDAGLSLAKAVQRIGCTKDFLVRIERCEIDPHDMLCTLQGMFETGTGLGPVALGFADDNQETPDQPRQPADRAQDAGIPTVTASETAGAANFPCSGAVPANSYFSERPWAVGLQRIDGGGHDLVLRLMRLDQVLSLDAADALIADLQRHVDLVRA